LNEIFSYPIPSKKDITFFRRKIISWFKKNGRYYPWREEKDPYKILIAELMLRRTKADQVVPVYKKFLKEFPHVEILANANQCTIDEILYPLGLKWRNSSFIKMARELVEKFNSKVPDNKKELKSLPGVGDYVAGAILLFAYGKKEWVVDNNIVRIFKRYFDIKTSKEARRNKHVIKMAKFYFSGKDIKKAFMGILDITALICKPRKPLCEKCVLNIKCKFINNLET